MRQSSIIRQANELKQLVRRHAARSDDTFKVGVEIEICLLDGKAKPVDAGPAIERLRRYHDIDYEYGKSQLEYRTEPVPFDTLARLNSQFEDFIDHLDSTVNKVYRREVFLGANPSPHILR